MALRSIITACLVIAVASGIAEASGTLTTPPLQGGVTYSCQAVNIGTRARQIDLAILSHNSGSIASKSCMGLQPGHVCELPGGNDSGENSRYCVVTVVTGNRKTVRAALIAFNGGVIAGVAPAQ